MTTICDASNDPAAWTSKEIGGKEGLVRRFSAEELAALDEVIAANRNRAADTITRAGFDHPVVNAMMAEVRKTLLKGRGAVILAGADVARLGLEDYKRLYWGLGTHLGNGAVQSYRRDKIGYVQKEEENPTGRGYLMDIELSSHTDFHELLSLAAVTKAQSGGESGIVSSLALHERIRATRPELLPPLYEGYYHESGGIVSEEKVPIFGCVDGKVSCYYHRGFMVNAAKQRGEAMPEALEEAMRYLSEMAGDPDLRADFMLEPGEMLFWHNFTALHSRTAFTDAPGAKRLLLRLWLNVPDGRPLPASFHDRARYMDRVHETGEAAIDYARKRA
ncbi:MAG TPA: TauD/TfdA family dioxygenase [Sphingomonadaceae bacterium]|jgi:hypothetical protein|nr:TauD/TfdA family dioxygenase [Sphingomonadaceae bacterium]